jgi:multicomponent Na+:H+ antiporter subunit E
MSAPAVLLRAVGFLALWLVLAGVNFADTPAAVVAVAAATWVSLRLSPPAGNDVSLPDLAVLVLRFPLQSLIAGIDVARRAFNPRLPLNVAMISYMPRLAEGAQRDAFTAYASLMPGTVPVGTDADGFILIHCLDATQPVAQQMADDEARFIRMLGRGND